jgi:predicted ribosomally synthesized peptide with SipW-like signal peptide
VSVLGTLAYLTDQVKVKNTFTVGKVEITVDEAEVNPDGSRVTPAKRVNQNKYHLVPGGAYTKDPTMTVLKDSEESYVRMLVTVNCANELDAIFATGGFAYDSILSGFDDTKWTYIEETPNAATNTVTYEFRYKNSVKPTATENAVLEPLFTTVTFPAALDSGDMESIKDLEIVIIGHAIQKVGFNDEASAWAAFDAQMG